MQKYVHLVDLVKSFPIFFSKQIAIPTSIYLQNLASIQPSLPPPPPPPRTSLVKFARSPRTDRPGVLQAWGGIQRAHRRRATTERHRSSVDSPGSSSRTPPIVPIFTHPSKYQTTLLSLPLRNRKAQAFCFAFAQCFLEQKNEFYYRRLPKR